MARIRHQHVLRIYDVGEHGSGYYLVADFVAGKAMDEYIADRKKIDISECVRILREVASGLSAVHEQQLIHRDIKPANIMLDGEGSALLMDFGLAKHLEAGEEELALTKKGYFVGTPYYAPPEQISGNSPMTPAADIYALGVTFYELLTAERPFVGKSVYELAQQHLSAAPRPPRELNAKIPSEVETLILRMLEKDPGERPADAVELLAAIDALGAAGGGTRQAKGVAAAGGGSRRTGLIAIGALVAAAVALALLIGFGSGPAANTDPAAALASPDAAVTEASSPAATAAGDPTAAQLMAANNLAAPAPTAPTPPAPPTAAPVDNWQSRPHIYAVMPFGTEDGGDTHFFRNRIVKALTAGDHDVVERHEIDALIAELKLTQTTFGDRRTAHKIGRLAGAHIIVFGEISVYQGKTDVITWALDVETGEVLAAVDIAPDSVPATVSQITNDVATALVYRSRIAAVADGEVTLPHGRRFGAAAGMGLAVLDAKDTTVAVLEVDRTTKTGAVARIVHGADAVAEGLRVEELPADE
jgi:hypothetical protein